MSYRVASVVAAAVLLVAAPDAWAYCRTTTTPIPADYNPVDKGCLGGTPLTWPSMPVTYQVFQGASSQFTLSEIAPIVDQAFAKWPAAGCSATDTAARPALSVQDQGSTAVADPCDGAPMCDLPADATHGIYFRDDSWPYTDGTSEIALTTVTYGVDDGRIFAAVMEINSHDHQFTTTGSPAEGGYSLEAVVTHEAGHFLGMAHSQDTSAVMYAYYQGDVVSLTDDDVSGICAAYPQPAPSSGCSLVPRSGSSGGPLAGGAFAAMLGLAAGRYRRRTLRRG